MIFKYFCKSFFLISEGPPLTAKIIQWQSERIYVFSWLCNTSTDTILFPKPLPTFLIRVTGERTKKKKKKNVKKANSNWVLNLQPPSHNSDILPIELPGLANKCKTLSFYLVY